MKQGVTVQPFLFIMALVVMAFVIIFGIKSVNDIRDTADLTELAVFKKDFEDKINVYYNFDIGSSGDVSFGVPPSVERVCFTNPGEPLTVAIPDPFFAEVLDNNIKSTVYILPLDAFSNIDFAISAVYVDPQHNPLCIPTRGRLHLSLETVFVDDELKVAITRSS